jgi:hypothetical protein
VLLYFSSIYFHIHFENEANALSFYQLFHSNNHILYKKFKNIVIKPSRKSGVDVSCVSNKYFNIIN